MDSPSSDSQFVFTLRSRNENNRYDPETLEYLRKLIKDEYGVRYLNEFKNYYPYREKPKEEPKINQPARHFTAFSNSNRPPTTNHKKDIGSSIFGIYSNSNIPDLDETCAFRVVYGTHKPSKKHKQWTDDGFILIENRNLTIYDENGKILSSAKPVPFTRYAEGEQFLIGSREYEISTRIKVEDVKNGNFSDPRAY